MLRVSALVLSIGMHATLFVVVGGLVLAGAGDRDPELLAGHAGSSGAFALSTSTDAPADEPAVPPAPPSPLENALPQPELRTLEDHVVEPVAAALVPVEIDELDDLQDASAETGAADSVGPFDFEPVAARLLPLRLGPSHPPKVADAEEPIAAAAAPPSPPPTSPTPAQPGASQAVAIGFADTLFAPSTYPRRAVAKGIEGTVILLALVAADGTVTACEIESSSGSELLDDAAYDALLEWRFKPRLVDGVARPFTARVPFRFSIPKELKTGAAPPRS